MSQPITPSAKPGSVESIEGTDMVAITVDDNPVSVADGATLLDALRSAHVATPTLCFGETLTPVNACRVCVVELEGSRTLVPSCSRKAESGMVVRTDSPRVRHSRKLVLELLSSTVDLSTTPGVLAWNESYGVDVSRWGTPAPSAPKRDNDLYVRDYAKCILCYKCVDACGEQWQGTFAISVAGRGAMAHISTEWDVTLPDSACVYCGNCVAVCPTGALVGAIEFDRRAGDDWDEARQTQTDTICTYCGVGCALTLHVQDNQIVKVTSPSDHSVTHGNLCIKGRFGFGHVQNR